MSSNIERTVGGFVFGTDEEAALGKKDEEKIVFMESRIDYSKPNMTQVIYNKAIQNMIFETPVGYAYLAKLKQRLHEEGLEEIADIPLSHASFQSKRNKTQKRIEPSKVIKVKRKLRISIVLNCMLAGLIATMLIIAINGKTPNILNYENAVLDKYAAWAEELSEREALIREKERELLSDEP